MSHQGSCHCGKISFSVSGEIDSLTECNCSLCSKRGGLLWFVGRDQLQLKSPETDLPTYRFNTLKIAHHFCDVCGCAPFSEAPGPDGKLMAAVNARCLDGVDLSPFKVVPWNGRDH
ncbi:GFA family protein [Pseudomonas sp. Gutcm_11s]|uniref:GFA family protein n=1 Tax=Pseudomonas sp. Gutcm_11s TaxID=3026088 RepID=UPI002360D669|nr:GFA family protein [Pseudomonas sp. Gutcm_11s]MDD0843436.1 GFA family protein [Pseudomonas sp. Gutcm_11s]